MLERNEEGKKDKITERRENQPYMYAVRYKPIVVKRTISLSSASRNHLKHGQARRRNEKVVITGTLKPVSLHGLAPPSNLCLAGRHPKHWREPFKSP